MVESIRTATAGAISLDKHLTLDELIDKAKRGAEKELGLSANPYAFISGYYLAAYAKLLQDYQGLIEKTRRPSHDEPGTCDAECH